MNKWVKRKWVRALRSGEYKQADGALVDDTTYKGGDVAYCCLGVAIAEMFPEGIQLSEDGWSRGLCVRDEDHQPTEDFIADDLAIMWGLDYQTQMRLANMNDAGKSFDEIADYIEREL